MAGLVKIPVSVSSSGDTQLVAAPGANKYIRVVSLFLQAGGSVNAKFYSGSSATGTALTGAMPMTNGGPPIQGLPMPQTPHGIEGHFDVQPNQALTLNLSGSVQVSGWLTYAVMAV
jgi:hypothetical protein